MKSPPMDQAVAVMDFAENFTIQAHWVQRQVTIHTVFLVRHAPNSTDDAPVLLKESLVMISDDIKQDSAAVYAFTNQLLIHISNNPGPLPIKVLHRFTDNCATQYKCKHSFGHLHLYPRIHNVNVVYHYTESGHGKGPSDGIGATVKQHLSRMIIADEVVLHTAYDVYLAAARTLDKIAKNDLPDRQKAAALSLRHIIYVLSRKIRRMAPPHDNNLQTINGTQKFHMVRLEGPNLKCQDLSCTCVVCLGQEAGP